MNMLDIYAGVRARRSLDRERQGIRSLIDRLIDRELDLVTSEFEAEMRKPYLVPALSEGISAAVKRMEVV